MNSVGAEVGQKMRSAIKAKLLELNCYVDDELPDYIMVMVANRRTKSQMNEDLLLFLNNKTSTFVEWLHIVLKKLKEVTVTNPEVYKKVAKRKASEEPDIKVKKEKFKKYGDSVKKESNSPTRNTNPSNTDEENTFDTTIFSEMNLAAAKDLEEIERKIRNVKSRLGITVDSDVDEEMLLKLKTEQVKPETTEFKENTVQREVELRVEEQPTEPLVESDDQISYTPEKPKRPSPITFEKDDFSTTPPRKSSVLSRLGKRISSTSDSDSKKRRLSFSESDAKSGSSRKRGSDRHGSKDEKKHKRSRSDRDRRDGRRSDDRRTSRSKRDSSGSEELRKRSDKSVLSRLGVMSKIYIPEKPIEDQEVEDELKTREVRSMVKVKPRSLPTNASQPNKNLLLKAVAEANKSVSETTTASSKNFSKLSEDSGEDVPSTRKLSKQEKSKIRNLILAQVSRDDSDTNDDEKEFEYVPKPIRTNNSELPEYVPSCRKSIEEPLEKETAVVKPRISAKARLSGKKTPSPIFFDNVSTKLSKKIDVPDSLLAVHPPSSVKTQERCKYWPNCRQGDKCEFLHPSAACETFPNCKYGDKCMFLHPTCKFGASCTKRDCPYTHSNNVTGAVKSPVTQPQTCRFFPKCTNVTCPFYHPKLCKFGKYCKNQSECSFSHPPSVKKSNLTWRPK